MSSNNPISGVKYFLRGASILRQPGVRQFVIIPLIINILLFLVLGYFVFNWAMQLFDMALATLPDWLQWLDWLFGMIVAMAMAVFTFFSFSIIANLISAPFNSYLSEAVASVVYEHEPLETDWAEALASIGPALKEEISKLSYTLIRSLLFLFLFIIPGINFIASGVWLIFSAWMLALQYMDYPFANKNIAFKDQRVLMKQRRFLGLGFGGAVMFGTMIPIVNLFVVPSAVAGATLLYIENFQEDEAGIQPYNS